MPARRDGSTSSPRTATRSRCLCARGVTDGSHTELVAGELEAGAAIIVGGGPRQQTAQTPESAPGARPRGPRLF